MVIGPNAGLIADRLRNNTAHGYGGTSYFSSLQDRRTKINTKCERANVLEMYHQCRKADCGRKICFSINLYRRMAAAFQNINYPD